MVDSLHKNQNQLWLQHDYSTLHSKMKQFLNAAAVFILGRKTRKLAARLRN